MKAEVRKCQKCKNDFTIEPNDFGFYEKIGVPPPTWCPRCRFVKRASFMNIYSLYKSTCISCKNSMISMYHPDKPYKVFCQTCWWGDNWDGTEYGMDVDFTRPFLEQIEELLKTVPTRNLDNQAPTLINSEYVNFASEIKNGYLLYFADYAQNSSYSSFVFDIKDCADCYRVRSSELCYGSVGLYKCFRVLFSEECSDCVDMLFSKNCIGCNNCFGCMNLNNQSYCIFNKKYSKEAYDEYISNLNLNNIHTIYEYMNKARQFWLTLPHRNYYGNNLNVNVSGNYIYESRNSKDLYMVTSVENSRFVSLVSVPSVKDSYDYSCWGAKSELIYESACVGENGYSVKFSLDCFPNSVNNDYCLHTISCRNVFGCVNLKKKSYCILNKQYTKDEYCELVPKIIRHMQDMPYKERSGRLCKYGDYFPIEFSPFGYNESMAQDFFPLEKEEIIKDGFVYFESKRNVYKSTIKAVDLSSDFKENPNIFNEIIECSCGKCFRFVERELYVLNKLNIALPNKCPECRRKERINRTNKPETYKRDCDKCGEQIDTSFAPGRPEIVYCEHCYQKEVY